MKNKKSVIGILILALLIISPLDLVPDFIPFIGWLDDIVYALGLVSGVLKMIRDKRIPPSQRILSHQGASLMTSSAA